MRKTKERQLEKAIKILKKLLIFLIVLFGVSDMIIAAMAFSSENGLFGYGAKIVLSSSMEKNSNVSVDEFQIKDIPVGSLIVIEYAPERYLQEWYDALQEGDVVTFVYKVVGGSITIVHRIKNIEKGENGYKITMAGDNSDSTLQIIDTADIGSVNRITGKVIYCSSFLGKTIYMMSDPIFALTIFMVASAILIARAYNDDPDRLLVALKLPNGGKYEKKK